MTERPQLSVVGGGQGEAEAAKAATVPGANDHLASALRAQREANADLMLEATANKAAADLAAKRQEGLVAQLQQEIAARRQVEAQLRELRLQARVLAEQLAQALSAGQAMRQENAGLAASLEGAEDTIAGLRQQASEAEARHRDAAAQVERLKAVTLTQSEQLAAAQAALDEEKVLRSDLDGQLTHIQAEATAAESSLRAAMGSNSALTAQLKSERAEAITISNALEAEKAVLAQEIEALKASYADMSGKAEVRYLRVNELTAELTRLREDGLQKDAAISALGSSVNEATSQSRALAVENADLVQRLATLQATVTRHEVSIADGSQTLEAMRASLTIANSQNKAITVRIEDAEAENARLAQAEQALGAELAELNTVLDERRKTIRQLQQELALIKLGRKKALPGS